MPTPPDSPASPNLPVAFEHAAGAALPGGAAGHPTFGLGPDPLDPAAPVLSLDALVDAVIDRIERRVIDELERRGRRQSWGG